MATLIFIAFSFDHGINCIECGFMFIEKSSRFSFLLVENCSPLKKPTNKVKSPLKLIESLVPLDVDDFVVCVFFLYLACVFFTFFLFVCSCKRVQYAFVYRSHHFVFIIVDTSISDNEINVENLLFT